MPVSLRPTTPSPSLRTSRMDSSLPLFIFSIRALKLTSRVGLTTEEGRKGQRTLIGKCCMTCSHCGKLRNAHYPMCNILHCLTIHLKDRHCGTEFQATWIDTPNDLVLSISNRWLNLHCSAIVNRNSQKLWKGMSCLIKPMETLEKFPIFLIPFAWERLRPSGQSTEVPSRVWIVLLPY